VKPPGTLRHGSIIKPMVLMIVTGHRKVNWPIPVALRSKAQVCGHKIPEIAGSNADDGMDVRVVFVV